MGTPKAQELLETGLAEFGKGHRDKARGLFKAALAEDPANRQAADYLDFFTEEEKDIQNQLGDLKRSPVVALSYQEILKLNISPKIGYILSLTDGFLTLEEIIATSSLGPEETRRGLALLKRLGVLRVV